MKKIIAAGLSIVMLLFAFTGCGKSNNSAITVVSREDGSGTRGAFVELLGILKDDVDNTTVSAEITNSTSAMMVSVAGNDSAIGYVSLGSLSDTVKAVKVDGVEATTANIENKTYAVSRPFNIVTKGELSEVAGDFVKFILSKDGQAIVAKEKYISLAATDSYSGGSMKGKIILAGSTSVAPVMEVLAEAYKKINTGVTIDIQQTGSSAGITSTAEGVCDIGMSSRELKDSETALGLTPTKIAMDGIAVIVNINNDIDALTSEQIMKIFTGEVTSWSEISK